MGILLERTGYYLDSREYENVVWALSMGAQVRQNHIDIAEHIYMESREACPECRPGLYGGMDFICEDCQRDRRMSFEIKRYTRGAIGTEKYIYGLYSSEVGPCKNISPQIHEIRKKIQKALHHIATSKKF